MTAGVVQKTENSIYNKFVVDHWTQLDRFLIIGSDTNSYYATAKELTLDNAKAIVKCATENPKRTVDRLVDISLSGRSPKVESSLFALAILANINQTRPLALRAMHKVCRTGTHLFQFINYLTQMGGWNRSLRTAVANWYNKKELDSVAYQVTKYRNRANWTHRDLIRLSHAGLKIKNIDEVRSSLYKWILGKDQDPKAPVFSIPVIQAFTAIQSAKEIPDIYNLIKKYSLVHEVVPNEFLKNPRVWEALLPHMPYMAIVRNLGRMTSNELLTNDSKATQIVLDKLQDVEALKNSRIHPIHILLANRTYALGHGLKGKLSWKPVQEILNVLDSMFYKAFKIVEPTNKRIFVALDISGSMDWPNYRYTGYTPTAEGLLLRPRESAAAIAMTVINTEPNHLIYGFTKTISRLNLTPGMKLNAVIDYVRQLSFSKTDCSLPMLYALENKIPVDTFLLLTDNENNSGDISPSAALQKYREEMGIPAKLISAAMVSNNVSIADPADCNMLDVAGFDSAVPQIISDFILN